MNNEEDEEEEEEFDEWKGLLDDENKSVLQFLFGINEFQLIEELNIFKQMDLEERACYEDDFSWYLASKYSMNI
jgi:hypothetical protein